MDAILQENGSYLMQERFEQILLERAETQELNNYRFVSAGDGMSVTEKIR